MLDKEGNEIDANGYKVVRGSLSDRNNSDAVVARIKPKPKSAPTAAAGSPPPEEPPTGSFVKGSVPNRAPRDYIFKFNKGK